MKKSISSILIMLFYFVSTAQSINSTIYTNDMNYVIGDAKQAFITNKITTQTQADNLILGFKAMKVNGVRIPIYADGVNPNEAMYNYFYAKAVAAGFKIFANPAQSSGGGLIACGILKGPKCKTNGDDTKTTALITRIKAFAAIYKCTWINPFNEDGKTGQGWSANQMNTLYSSLYKNVNGAELIGPCAWGIPASIDVLKNTKITDYITVAATHNLGFNHSSWPAFIALAKAKALPVWDSEVTNFDKKKNGTRLKAALDAGVNGLVLYNSWNLISLTDGSLNSSAQDMMLLYLK